MARARRTNKHLRPARPLDTSRHASKHSTGTGTHLVREIPADRATKAYVCPGCQNTIPTGTAHVVAWPEQPGLGFDSGLEQRRHWHKHCWRLHR